MNDQDRVAAPADAQDRGTRSPRPGAVFLLELGGDFRLLNANHQALGDFSHLTPPPSPVSEGKPTTSGPNLRLRLEPPRTGEISYFSNGQY